MSKFFAFLRAPSLVRKINFEEMSRITRSRRNEIELSAEFSLKSAKPRLNVSNKRRCKETTLPANIQETKVEIKREPAEEVSERSERSPPKRKHVKIEYDSDIEPKLEDVKKERWSPKNWQETLTRIRTMRAAEHAPVDEMGCHKCHDESAPAPVMRYQTLVALMLSSQTKDQVTHAAMRRLTEHGLTVENVLATSDEELGRLIYPVSFWKSKVKYIKKTTETLRDRYSGDIPSTVEGLCGLAGVGPKMAHICMDVAWNTVTGIGVDTHVHRIANRIGWLPKPTKTPEATRQALEGWLPYDLWSEVNHLLVGFGQTVCRPVGPQCTDCLNCDLCPFPKKKKIK